MTLEGVKNFDIGQIANSGQCFRLDALPEKPHTWRLIAYGKYLEIKQQPGSSVVEFSCTRTEFEQIWRQYFDLEADYQGYLKSIYGVGHKVANCIMLFGLHRMDSVPKDVWINKIIKEHYAGKFPVERYKGFAGVIQQYIFSYASNKSHSKDG